MLKFSISQDKGKGGIGLNATSLNRTLNTVYFKDMETAKNAINTFRAEIEEVFNLNY